MKIPYLNFQTIAGFLMLLISGYAYGEEPLLLRGVVFMEAEGLMYPATRWALAQASHSSWNDRRFSRLPRLFACT